MTNFDFLYSWLMDSTWIFVMSWLVLLVTAYILVFSKDTTGADLPPGLTELVPAAQSKGVRPIHRTGNR